MTYRDHRGRVLSHPPADLVPPPVIELPPHLDLATYDYFLVSISGGKDSWNALHAAVQAASAAGLHHRVHAVFADLGADDEWPGALELTKDHAAAFAVPHHVVFREAPGPGGLTRQQGLLDYIQGRHQQMWPLPNQPYCRSAMKRDPIRKLKTQLAAQHREAGHSEPARILEIMGLRAQESGPRSRQPVFSHRADDSNSHRHVDLWLPIHHLTEQQVWAQIDQADAPWHWAYLFLPRLSCRFCIVAPREQLITAARLDLTGARRRAQLSDQMGHDFKHGLSMWEVLAEAEARGPLDTGRLTRLQRQQLRSLRGRA